MHGPWLAALALTALGLPAMAGAQEAAVDAVDPAAVEWLHRCVQHVAGAGQRDVSRRAHRGIVQLEADCPGLTEILDGLNVGVQLNGPWRERLDSERLSRLADLLDHYEFHPPSPRPDVAALPALAASLRNAPPSQSLWERFKAWLHSTLSPSEPARQASGLDWLDRLLGRWRMSASTARLIGYGSLALVIALALWILWRELRLSGVLQRSARGPGPATAPARADWQSPGAAPLRVEDLQGMPSSRRAQALLVQALCRTGRLGAARALTHRQLVEHARLEDAGERRCFEQVARLAERQLYGVPLPEAQCEPIVDEGIGLYRRINLQGSP